MKLTDIKTLKEVSTQYNIPLETLRSRLKNLEKDVDYRLLGVGQGTLLSPQGVEKITKK